MDCDLDIEIKAIKTDSRLIEQGDLFVYIRGKISDGHNFINSAINNGTVAILSEEHIECIVPLILREKTKNILPNLLDKFYGYKNKKINCMF